MRWRAILVCSALLGAAEIGGSNVQSVYLMPMAGGLDQYLTHQLTRAGVFAVVTDPKRADAIFTDRLGETLQAQLEKLYPDPKPKSAEAGKADTADARKEDAAPAAAKSVAVQPLPASTFGRGKGTLFLVEVKSRRVLWSAYERPRNSSSGEIERVATRIVDRLTKQLSGK